METCSLLCGGFVIVPAAIVATAFLRNECRDGHITNRRFWIWIAPIWIPIGLATYSTLHWMYIGEAEAIARGEDI